MNQLTYASHFLLYVIFVEPHQELVPRSHWNGAYLKLNGTMAGNIGSI